MQKSHWTKINFTSSADGRKSVRAPMRHYKSHTTTLTFLSDKILSLKINKTMFQAKIKNIYVSPNATDPIKSHQLNCFYYHIE